MGGQNAFRTSGTFDVLLNLPPRSDRAASSSNLQKTMPRSCCSLFWLPIPFPSATSNQIRLALLGRAGSGPFETLELYLGQVNRDRGFSTGPDSHLDRQLRSLFVHPLYPKSQQQRLEGPRSAQSLGQNPSARPGRW